MTLSSKPSSSSSSPSWNEFVPGAAWAVENLLTEEECQKLIETAKQHGIESMQYAGDTRHRQRVTVRLGGDSQSNNIISTIRSRLWERVKDQIPQEIIIDETTVGNTEGLCHVATSDCLIGRWTPSGLHSTMNVAYCTGKGHLAAHRDAEIVVSEHERSFLTINGYLTGRPPNSGGATRFLKENIEVTGSDIRIDEQQGDVLYRIESDQAGKAVVFLHGLVHDGEPLAEGSPEKWVFRSAVYYKRDPESAPVMTPEEREARKLLKEAETAEESGLISKAMKLYSRAYKLHPSLEFSS